MIEIYIMGFNIIACFSSKDRGIGLNGDLPWSIKEDMVYFSRITKMTRNPRLRNAVIMGRKTFESMNSKPLPGRLNICVSSNAEPGIKNNVFFCRALDEAVRLASQHDSIENIFIIGGESIYRQAIVHPMCDKLYINIVDRTDVPLCDTFFPEIDADIYELCDEFEVCPTVRGTCYRRK
jgi:dihydrofolate reductase